MIAYWLVFMLLLFAVEPRGVLEQAQRGAGPERAWKRLQWLHASLLMIAVVIIAGAAAGSHGF